MEAPLLIRRNPPGIPRRGRGSTERHMQQVKNVPDFADRQAAANAAKQAILAKFKPKPTVQAAEPINREAERAAKAQALRDQPRG